MPAMTKAELAAENEALRKALSREMAERERLAEALSEAVEQQKATSEILRVISQAHTDVQPVFDAIAESALRLFRAWAASVFRYDGEFIQMVARRAGHGGIADLAEQLPYRPTGEWPADRAALERSIQHFADVETDPLAGTRVREWAQAHGWRSLLQVPMLRGDDPVGVIAVTRADPGGFSPGEIALLQTFADQAVIAIENVRLFKELEARNHQLTEALEQQTATSEILRVISGTPTDVQPVFEAIVGSAAQLCDAVFCVAYRFDGALIHPVAHHNMDALEALQKMWPAPPSHDTVTARSILEHSVVHVEDVMQEGVSTASITFGGTLGGYRTMLAVPMVRDGVPIGTISVARRERRPFSDAQIQLLNTFADQAVIAIENVRLFKELEARTQELTRSVEELTALSDVGRAVSSTLELGQYCRQSWRGPTSSRGRMGARSGSTMRRRRSSTNGQAAMPTSESGRSWIPSAA
jgi:two-component system NtrC family sensor kinase